MQINKNHSISNFIIANTSGENMARVTVEDCMKIIPSRFELVVLAAQRAREISYGSKSVVDKDNKDAVISLREIAVGAVTPEGLRESIVRKYQNRKYLTDQNDDFADDGFSSADIAENINDIIKSTTNSYAAHDQQEDYADELELELEEQETESELEDIEENLED